MFAKRDPMLRAIGARLARFREAAKLTQEQLAKRVKLTAKSVSRHENATRSMSLTDALAYANALEISLDQLCGRDSQVRTVGRTEAIHYLNEDAVRRIRDAQTIEELRDLYTEGVQYGGRVLLSESIVSEADYNAVVLEIEQIVDGRLGKIPHDWAGNSPHRSRHDRRSGEQKRTS